jgi:hypothetical protein
MLTWLHRRRDASRLMEVEAVMLVVQYGLAAYSEARQRQQDAHNAETFAHWGRVAQVVAERTGERMALVTGAQEAIDAGRERGPSSSATRN